MRDAQSVILVVAAKTFNRLPLPEVLSFTSLSIWGYRGRSTLSVDYGRGDRSAYKILLPELLRGDAFGPRKKKQMDNLLLVDTTIEGASPSHARQE
jgi:hypothetical protein